MEAKEFLKELGIDNIYIRAKTTDPSRGTSIALYELLERYAETKLNNVGLAYVSVSLYETKEYPCHNCQGGGCEVCGGGGELVSNEQ